MDMRHIRIVYARGDNISRSWLRKAMHANDWGHEGIMTTLEYLGAVEPNAKGVTTWSGVDPVALGEILQTWVVCLDEYSEQVARMTLSTYLVEQLAGSPRTDRRLYRRPVEEWDIPDKSTAIMEYIDAHPDVTISEVTEVTGYNRHAVRAVMNRLRDAGILEAHRIQGHGRPALYRRATA